MTIKYTVAEWGQLSFHQQLERLDLAPEEGLREIERLQSEAVNSPQVQSVLSAMAFAFSPEKNPILKAQHLIEFYRNNKSIDTAELVEFIEQLNLGAVGIACLLSECLDRKITSNGKDTGWKPAIIKQWLEVGSEYASKEEFCEYYAGAFVERPDGEKVQAPKAETIRKQLTEQDVAEYQDWLDLERRRSGIC